jgi:hypothetical protein
VAWKYLNFFLDDDERLAWIGAEYGSGRMLTGDIKAELIQARPALNHPEPLALVIAPRATSDLSGTRVLNIASAHSTGNIVYAR